MHVAMADAQAITCVSMYSEDTNLLRGDCISWRFLLIQRQGKERAKQSKPAMERESERGVGEVAKDTARETHRESERLSEPTQKR